MIGKDLPIAWRELASPRVANGSDAIRLSDPFFSTGSLLLGRI